MMTDRDVPKGGGVRWGTEGFGVLRLGRVEIGKCRDIDIYK